MSDEADKANDYRDVEEESKVRAAQIQASRIDPGYPGECYECGEHFKRIVKGFCARCREDLGLP